MYCKKTSVGNKKQTGHAIVSVTAILLVGGTLLAHASMAESMLSEQNSQMVEYQSAIASEQQGWTVVPQEGQVQWDGKEQNDTIVSETQEETIYFVQKAELPAASQATSGGASSVLKSNQPRKKAADLSDWKLLLINRENPLASNFSVDTTTLKNGQKVDERIASALDDMIKGARAQGLSPVICSGFRTREKQQELFDAQVQRFLGQSCTPEQAREKAGQWVAVPGTSEHESGLAVDIVSLENQNLNETQADTPEQQWLMKNAHRYGFILRYPSDKTEVTGITYEPWHYRYVGKEAAKQIYESGVCLEEYCADAK